MAFNVHGVIFNDLFTPLNPRVPQTTIIHGSLARSPLTSIPVKGSGRFDINGLTDPTRGAEGSVAYDTRIDGTDVHLTFYFQVNGRGANRITIQSSHPFLHGTRTSYVGPTEHPINNAEYRVFSLARLSAEDNEGVAEDKEGVAEDKEGVAEDQKQ